MDSESDNTTDRSSFISDETYERISALIHSDDSPVGIDAKKTHILILDKLERIEKRLNKLEDDNYY
jgi:hypothetical protein